MPTLRIAMAQINPVVGDLAGNRLRILEYIWRAARAGADLVALPELALTGYPPEDLLLKPDFIEANLRCLKSLAREVRSVTAVVGFVDRHGCYPRHGRGGSSGSPGDSPGGVRGHIYNAAAVIHGGRVAAVYHKMLLPNYGVFDEQRYFQAGNEPLNFTLNGVTVGLGICEDIWFPDGPARLQALAGAEVIVNINASPFYTGKSKVRERMLATRAVDNTVMIAYNNTVGGQDELVYDGRSMFVDCNGDIMARAGAFREELLVADLKTDGVRRARLRDLKWRNEQLRGARDAVRLVELDPAGGRTKRSKKRRLPPRKDVRLSPKEEVYNALVLGTRDYVKKNNFTHVVVGLSGGIDSALVTVVAVEALGAEFVTAVFMPSRYTARESTVDARKLAGNLGIDFVEIGIEDTVESYTGMLAPVFKRGKAGVAEENIQARIRGNILMALSNRFGWLVLTTGNKSEMSVGYSTLYGDMAGGFAVIKDVAKTVVYDLARWINRRAGTRLIPERIITRAPSAELRANQTDQDTLPPYDLLDKILKAYIEEDKGLDDIVAAGFPKRVVKRVISMVDKSEYKRRQAAPGIKITPRAFGKDRRMPITNRYGDGSSRR
jgi:NAD+ synthase (glutamine-hydrolysing)